MLKMIYTLVTVYILYIRLNNDLSIFVFKPLNDINQVVDKISKDPVNSEIITKLKKNFESGGASQDPGAGGYETKVIQSAIIRISALLAIGFGEAGGEILKENMSSSEGLNPMLSGKKINAIFGFCFIQHFNEINEIFQEKTMIFVNKISDIIHSSVDKFNGHTNKNIGDCFLLCWKLKNNKSGEGKGNNINSIVPQGEEGSPIIASTDDSETADCALLSFLDVFKKINKSRAILAYRKDPDLIKHFGKKFTVQIGFGLHCGWGIEGAIGSYFKIDCSYLSPNVNLAARLETATHIFGVDILFSGQFYNSLSDFMKSKCRKIDRVCLKGSKLPIELYTVDLNRNIKPGKLTSKKDRMSLREKSDYYAYKKRKLWKKYKTNPEHKPISEIYYKESRGFREILKSQKSDLFLRHFEDGIDYYLQGDWEEAKANLSKALYLDKNDGPTQTILKYITDRPKPEDWDGYRWLTSKT